MHSVLSNSVTELTCLTSSTSWITMTWDSGDSWGTLKKLDKLSFLFGNHCIQFINPESTSLLTNLVYWRTNVTNALVRKSIAMRVIDILWSVVDPWRAVWSWCTLLCYLRLLSGVMACSDLMMNFAGESRALATKKVLGSNHVCGCALSSSSGGLLME